MDCVTRTPDHGAPARTRDSLVLQRGPCCSDSLERSNSEMTPVVPYRMVLAIPSAVAICAAVSAVRAKPRPVNMMAEWLRVRGRKRRRCSRRQHAFPVADDTKLFAGLAEATSAPRGRGKSPESQKRLRKAATYGTKVVLRTAKRRRQRSFTSAQDGNKSRPQRITFNGRCWHYRPLGLDRHRGFLFGLTAQAGACNVFESLSG